MAKEYIEKTELLKYLEDRNKGINWMISQYNADWIYSWLENVSAADVVEVVRCKDCIYHNRVPCPMHLSLKWTSDNDFCSYGERKDNG